MLSFPHQVCGSGGFHPRWLLFQLPHLWSQRLPPTMLALSSSTELLRKGEYLCSYLHEFLYYLLRQCLYASNQRDRLQLVSVKVSSFSGQVSALTRHGHGPYHTEQLSCFRNSLSTGWKSVWCYFKVPLYLYPSVITKMYQVWEILNEANVNSFAAVPEKKESIFLRI